MANFKVVQPNKSPRGLSFGWPVDQMWWSESLRHIMLKVLCATLCQSIYTHRLEAGPSRGKCLWHICYGWSKLVLGGPRLRFRLDRVIIDGITNLPGSAANKIVNPSWKVRAVIHCIGSWCWSDQSSFDPWIIDPLWHLFVVCNLWCDPGLGDETVRQWFSFIDVKQHCTHTVQI